MDRDKVYRFTFSRGGNTEPIKYYKREEELDEREINLLVGNWMNEYNKLPKKAQENIYNVFKTRIGIDGV